MLLIGHTTRRYWSVIGILAGGRVPGTPSDRKKSYATGLVRDSLTIRRNPLRGTPRLSITGSEGKVLERGRVEISTSVGALSLEIGVKRLRGLQSVTCEPRKSAQFRENGLRIDSKSRKIN
jgi:hypothetical protein